jgi:CRISPR-associated protein Csd1
MGIIKALIESTARFQEQKTYKELGVGFDYRPINWVIEFDTNSDKLTLRGKYKEEMIRCVPMRADRSGKISKANIKPNLFVDNARYALGLEKGEATEDAFEAFKELHEAALANLLAGGELGGQTLTQQEEIKKELSAVLAYLRLTAKERKERLEQVAGDEPDDGREREEDEKKRRKAAKAKVPDPTDVVAFTTTTRYPFDSEFARSFWMHYLQKECSDEKGICSVCGDKQIKSLLRILPFKLRLFGERCPILSVNTDEQQSFGSLGKGQLGNSPICIDCAGRADRLLKMLALLDKDDKGKDKLSGRHAVVLARDPRQSLGNQIAVFWTKEQAELHTGGGEKIQFEDLAKLPIEELDEIPQDEPLAKAGQCRALLEAPFTGGNEPGTFPVNRFYLTVLSPNKSRLVVREWLEERIDKTHEKIRAYMAALEIIHPDGLGMRAPPLPSILEALCSYTSSRNKNDEKPRLQTGPDLIRKLIRCIYTGTPPPHSLLTRAVRCFRVPDPPTDDTPQGRKQRDRQMLRRMAMAAAMKLVLTHKNEGKEQEAMKELKTEYDATSNYKHQAPYNCGILLAILEAIQRRASSSGRGVNTTLVDRYYGAASTAPASVFANLINMATKAHLPKLRRDGKEFFRVRSRTDTVDIKELMEEACDAIDAAGGFPPPLKPDQQAQFALGFYHQRAEFNLPRKQSATSRTDKAGTKGDQ